MGQQERKVSLAHLGLRRPQTEAILKQNLSLAFQSTLRKDPEIELWKGGRPATEWNRQQEAEFRLST